MKKYKRLTEKSLQLKDALSSGELKLYSLLNEAVNELEEAVKQFKKDKTHIVRENMTIYEATQIGNEFRARIIQASKLLNKFNKNFNNLHNRKYDLSLYLYAMCRFKLIGIKWGNISSSWYSGSNAHSLILEISNMAGLNELDKGTFNHFVNEYHMSCGWFNEFLEAQSDKQFHIKSKSDLIIPISYYGHDEFIKKLSNLNREIK